MRIRVIKFLISLLNLTTLSTAFAQAPEISWQAVFGSNNNDNAWCSAPTPDGGLIIGGHSNSLANEIKSEDPMDEGTWYYDEYIEDWVLVYTVDIWVVKLDAEGVVEWENTIGGTKSDELYAINTTQDGGYILGGTSISGISGDKTLPNWDPTLYYRDCWILKLDSLGSIEWQKVYGGNKGDGVEYIEQTEDGGYIVGAGSASMISGNKTEGLVGGAGESGDIWILKLDANGDLEWQNDIGGGDGDFMQTIHQLSDGGYIVGAYSRSNMGYDKSEMARGETDFWVLRLNASGMIEWQRTIGGNRDDYLFDIKITGDGGYIIAGYSQSEVSGEKTEPSDIYYDYWAVRLDSIGNIEWQNTITGSTNDYMHQVLILPGERYLFSGTSTSSASGDKSESSIGSISDIWLVCLDSIGSILWENTVNTDGSDGDHGMFLRADGSVVICAVTNAINGYDKPLDGYGELDYWVFVIDCYPTGEVCNGIDDDCNGIIDDDWLFTDFYFDGDADGYGDPYTVGHVCGAMAPDGFISDSTDCNDLLSAINPGMGEFCNLIDDNCNGLADEGLTYLMYYADIDGDTYGDALIDSISCIPLIGFVENDLDCNDADAAINPDATELCNIIDDNCNTIIDEGLTIYTFFLDADGDTYGDPATLIDTCVELVPGYVLNNFDCNDMVASSYPGAEEICNNLDDDCDGVVDDSLAFYWQYADADGDMYGNISVDTVACLEISGYVIDSTDCNDSDPNIYPGAIEVLNGIDDDCDGESDESLTNINNQPLTLTIHPIPASDYININCATNAPYMLKIYTTSGAVIYQNPQWNGEAVRVGDFPTAIYYLQLLQNNNVGYGCFVKQ